jgi:hypothetical protein
MAFGLGTYPLQIIYYEQSKQLMQPRLLPSALLLGVVSSAGLLLVTSCLYNNVGLLTRHDHEHNK